MKKVISTLALAALVLTSCSKDETNVENITFEELAFTNGATHEEGANLEGEFTSGELSFENSYSSYEYAGVIYDSWSKFAYSNEVDSETEGYENQYSVYCGKDADGNVGGKFGLCYSSPIYDDKYNQIGYEDNFVNVIGDGEKVVRGCEIAINTYAYLALKNGTSMSLPIGGVEGTESDYYKVVIEGYNKAGELTGTIDYYLADYRYENNDDDYIVKSWKRVDLTHLGMVSKINFRVETSVLSAPSYFCIDNIEVEL